MVCDQPAISSDGNSKLVVAAGRPALHEVQFIDTTVKPKCIEFNAMSYINYFGTQKSKTLKPLMTT